MALVGIPQCQETTNKPLADEAFGKAWRKINAEVQAVLIISYSVSFPSWSTSRVGYQLIVRGHKSFNYEFTICK